MALEETLIANNSSLKNELDYLEQVLLNTHRIDPNLYEEYDVKRGLRDSNGKGVLTGQKCPMSVDSMSSTDGRFLQKAVFIIKESMLMILFMVLEARNLDLKKLFSFFYLVVFQKKKN